jgi:hypothetical protein
MPTENSWLSFAGYQMLTKDLRFQANACTHCDTRNCPPSRFSIDAKPGCRALRLGRGGAAGAWLRLHLKRPHVAHL